MIVRTTSVVSALFVLLAGVSGCSSSDKKADAPADDTQSSTDGTDTGGTDSSTETPSSNDGPGAGSGTDTPPDGGTDSTPPVTIPFACPGGTIAPGLNENFDAGGQKRKFFVDFPADTSKPMAILFSWYGFGDNMQNFHDGLSFKPDEIPEVPTIIVTASDLGYLPPKGLSWNLTDQDSNPDIALFEAIVGCLAAQQKIDGSRIYEFGFSAGAVLTNLIYSKHPKVIAAVVSESGAWMNDEAERKLVKIPAMTWNWPALVPEDRGNVLLTHGGSEDIAAFNVFNLEESAKAAVPFLTAAQRTVVDCPHTNAHHLHPELLQPLIMKYLFAHRSTDQQSPFASGGIDFLPQGCTLHKP